MKLILFCSLAAVFSLTSWESQAAQITNAKAAELSLHRIERLVILKKIEESFQSKVKSLSLVLLPHQDPTEASFKATIFQYPATDGSQKSIDIILNEDGKAIGQTVNAGGEALGAPTWPDPNKDPVTLAENSLHYILEGAVTKPELLPYFNGLTSFAITQETNSEGIIHAVVDIGAGPENPILRIRIKTNGDYESAEFLPMP